MEMKRGLLRHFLAALAYRTQKARRGAPSDFGSFSPGHGVRSPMELLRHMTSVLGYARTFLVGGRYRPEPLPSLQAEVSRFHGMIDDLARHLKVGTPLQQGMTPERALQAPFADAKTHAGQLAVLTLTDLHYHGTIGYMAMAHSRVTAQGQISIPAEVRRKLGVGPGSVLEWDQDGSTIVVRRAGRYSSLDVHRALFKRAPEPSTLAELEDGIRSYVKRRHARR